MLDKRCLALLNIINGECVGTGYKIFSISDLVASMPIHFGMDGAGVYECVKTLSEREYISVKYQDDKEICLSPLTKGRLVFENKIDEELEKSRAEKRYFFFSFIGGLLGGGAAVILTVIILAITGVL